MKKKAVWRWLQVHLPEDAEYEMIGKISDELIVIFWDKTATEEEKKLGVM